MPINYFAGNYLTGNFTRVFSSGFSARKCCTQDVVSCNTTKGLTYRFNLAVLIRSQDDRDYRHFLSCPLSSRGGRESGGVTSTASCARHCMNNHKLAICFTHRTSTWHNGHLGSSFNYLKTCVAAGACTCVRTRGRGFLSRARTHGSPHGADKLPALSFGWRQMCVCLCADDCSGPRHSQGDFASL